MKEHSLFLLAGFPEGEMEMRKQADWLRKEFEDGLKRTVQLSDGVVGESILESGEIVTEFTHKAEQQTERLAGIPIDSRITEAEQKLRSGCRFMVNQNMVRNVRMLNRRMLSLVNGLIEFKERILREVKECRLYTSNYPLLVEHILREARLYRSIISELEQRGRISSKDLRETEMFWNQIMMEHAQFIRGLLDPTECELIETAEGFAKDYRRLLKEAKEQDMRALEEMTKRSIRITKDYQQFKSAGTAGIVGCQIRSVILPLLADHVLREANHYLRILEV